MINVNEFFMREALIEAEKSFELNEVPVGCVIVHNGIVIVRGFNLMETTECSRKLKSLVA